MRAAWWLARPSIKGIRIGRHYEIIADLQMTQINRATRCYRMESGTLFVYGFQVLKQETPERAALQQAIDSLEQQGDTK